MSILTAALFGFPAALLEYLVTGHGPFGSGGRVSLPPPPRSMPVAGPHGEGPAQEEIDRINAALAEMQKQLDAAHTAGEHAAEAAGMNSDDGRLLSERILADADQLSAGLASQGATPEADAGRLAAVQQQVDELAKTVRDKADAAQGIADSLRNMGMGGLPGMGMPGMGGGPGLGMPGMGMPAGLSPMGGPGLGAPAPVSPAGNDAVSARDDVLKSSPIQHPDDPVAAPVAGTGATVPAGKASPPPAPAAATPKPRDITLPGGQVVQARSPEGAQAVRNAIEKPTGTGDMATAAYAGTGVDIPADGADPGRKVDPTDVKPGDIAVCDDHTAIVAGNGQIIGPDGQLQPLGVVNDWQGFKGFFDPTAAADAESTAAVPVAAPPPPTSTATDPNNTTVLASPGRPPVTAGGPDSRPREAAAVQ